MADSRQGAITDEGDEPASVRVPNVVEPQDTNGGDG